MLSGRDLWQAATLLIVKRYGDDAMLEAADTVAGCPYQELHPHE